MATILFTNLKGGVAKTTNAIAVAECLASQGKPTLFIDADHQCTASELLLGEEAVLKLDQRRRTLHDLLTEMMKPEFESRQFNAYVNQDASNISGGLEELSVISCSVRIDDFQTNWARGGHGFSTWDDFRRLFSANQRRFSRWLEKTFTYVIVDCPPSLALQVRLLLRVADSYVIPCQPNRLSIRGAKWLRERIQTLGFKKDCLGTLWSMCRGSDRMHKSIIDKAAKGQAGLRSLPKAFNTQIPLSTSIAHTGELTSEEPSSFRGKYGTKFGRVYESVCEEIMERLQDMESERQSRAIERARETMAR